MAEAPRAGGIERRPGGAFVQHTPVRLSPSIRRPSF